MVEMDHVVGGKFKLGRKIGSGSFGELYLGMVTLLSIFCFSLLCCIFNIYSVLCFDLFTGVNVQTGEEVAVKLVSDVFLIINFQMLGTVLINCWLVYVTICFDYLE